MKPTRTVRRPIAAAATLAVAAALTLATQPTGTAGSGDSGSDGGPFPETIALPPGLQPEGITSRGHTFYVGSLANGRIVEGDLRRGTTDLLVPGKRGRVAVGMQIERRDRDRLWVAGGPTGTVTVYDACSGRQLRRWHIPGSGFLNDVTVTKDAAYVTDSFVQRLVVIPLGKDGELPRRRGATTLALTGDISYVDGEFNANGIRSLRGGDTLVLVQSATGTLFRVDPDTGASDAVEITEGELVSGDGLEIAKGRLFVVRGGGGDDIAVVDLEDRGGSGEVERLITDDDFDVPTTATFAVGRLWAVNARFGTPPTPTTEYDVVQVDRH